MAKCLFLLLSLFSCLSFANPLDKKEVKGLEHLARIQTKDFYVYTSTLEEVDIFGVIVIDAWILINSDTPDLHNGKTYFSSQMHTLVNCETKEVTERYLSGRISALGQGSHDCGSRSQLDTACKDGLGRPYGLVGRMG